MNNQSSDLLCEMSWKFIEYQVLFLVLCFWLGARGSWFW